MPLLALPFPAIDPVALSLGPIQLRWYALAYIVGLLLGWRLARRVIERPGWRICDDDLDDFLLWAALGVVLGGRLGYALFYSTPYYLENPIEILKVWRGGMSFHGGLIGVIVAIVLFAKKRGLAVLELGDLLAIVAPIGLFFGRIANFVNGELWGRPSDVPWAFVFPAADDLPRHPSQLYEAALEGALLFAALWIAARGVYRPAAAGRLAGVFLAGYAGARFVVEFFREPDAHIGYLFGFLTMGQILCLPMAALGGYLIWRAQSNAARIGTA